MPNTATILIPDISGYTDFITRTELEHSTHIISELLDVLLKTNEDKFKLIEIEGDALLPEVHRRTSPGRQPVTGAGGYDRVRPDRRRKET